MEIQGCFSRNCPWVFTTFICKPTVVDPVVCHGAGNHHSAGRLGIALPIVPIKYFDFINFTNFTNLINLTNLTNPI